MLRLDYNHNDGWGALAKAGKNRLFFIILCISWLGVMVRSSISLEWEVLCLDFHRALLAMKVEMGADSNKIEEERENEGSTTIVYGTKRITTHRMKRGMLSNQK
jgi:hypothetical protein